MNQIHGVALKEAEVSSTFTVDSAADNASTAPMSGSSKSLLTLGAPLRSYDVFDTVITRLVGLPASVFRLLGHLLSRHGGWHGSAEQFVAARVEAERRARDNTPGLEVTIASIYTQLGFAHNIDAETLKFFERKEMALERQLLRAVPATLQVIDLERSAGSRIAFISDMYLSHDVILEWLDAFGVFKPQDSLWVSSEHSGSKGDGRLFDHVAMKVPCPAGEWTHMGDNWRADIAVPQGRGIRAVPFSDCHLTPAEEDMERHAAGTTGLASLLAGASRWTRISVTDATPDQRLLNEYAAQVGGPVVYAFVLWVLRTAQRQGIRRLWFMARDGQVMLPIARSIAKRLQIDVEVGYLYGGRQVVKVAALRQIDETAVGWISGGGWFLSVAEVLMRVGVIASDVLTEILEFGLPESGPIGFDRMPQLMQFLKYPSVANRILSSAAERRRDVLDYFRQCRLIDGEPCCVIDIGWQGTVLKAIRELIGAEETARHTYLYFGLFARPKECAGLDMRGYLFDGGGKEKKGLGFDIPSLSAAMEIFCQADHGSVLHLRRNDDRFDPVCRQETRAAGDRWDIPFFQRRLAEFSNAVAIELCPDPDADLRALADQALRRALSDPTVEQANLMGSLPFADDQAGSATQPFAHPYGLSDLRQTFRDTRLPIYGMNWWVPGAWRLTDPRMRFLLKVAIRVGRLRRRWF